MVYALCAYNIVYSQNLLWLDGVIILPLVFLGIDRLIEKEKPLLFYSMLVLTIFCNYYIGYMTCIASLVYFIYKLYLKNNYKISLKDNKKDILYFFKYALLAVGTTMIILLPSVFSLMAGKAESNLSEFIPKQTYASIELISRMFIGSFNNSDLSGGCPNIFISLFMIVLVLFYFFNNEISRKERKASLILILFFIASFTFYSIDIVWHTFQHPAGFPFRYSFIYDFILLIIAYKSYININKVDKKWFKKSLPAVIIITLIMDKLMYNSNMYYKIIASGVLMVIYILYLCYSKKQNINKIITVLIALEMTVNGLLVVCNMKYQNREEYVNFVNDYGQIVDKIKQNDNSFYRLEKDYLYSTNDSLLLNYNGISHFSSTYEGNNNKLLGDYLGIFNRFYITNYHGSTPVTNSLFGIKYVILNNDINYYDKIDSYKIDNEDTYVYKNQYNLPLGFMVSDKLKKLELEELKPFENQNNILKTMTGNDIDVFLENKNVTYNLNNVKLKENSKEPFIYNTINTNYAASIKYKIKVENKGVLYAYISSDYNKKIDVKVNGKSIIDTSDQNDYRYNILELGEYNIDDEVDFEIILLDNSIKFNDVVFYTLNKENFATQINDLQQSEALNITEFKSNYIKANINVESDNKILYTSIPLDKGWTIKVDGKKVDKIEIFNSLIGIDVTKGEHVIEFSYIPRGLYAGGFVSLVSLLFVIVLKKRK